MLFVWSAFDSASALMGLQRLDRNLCCVPGMRGLKLFAALLSFVCDSIVSSTACSGSHRVAFPVVPLLSRVVAPVKVALPKF